MSGILTMNAVNRCLRPALLLITLLVINGPAYADGLTQRDWMVTIVDAMGWSYGLPDEPQDPDYINILNGNRMFRFEAEDIFRQGYDNVSVVSFRNFGAFSGRGWLNGSREPTDVHLRFNLPITGEYRVNARLRQPGHIFKAGDKAIAIDGELLFVNQEIGTFQFQAGPQEIIVTLPANGSLDFIELSAPNQRKITPLNGWQPDQQLSWQDIQTTLLQLLQLADFFPLAGKSLEIEAEELDQQKVAVVSSAYLGHPSGGKWLRASQLPEQVRFPLALEDGGFYDLTLRVLGSSMTVRVGDRDLTLEAKPYLDDFTFKGLFFFPGKTSVVVSLPPDGGVDQLSLEARAIETDSSASLLGLETQNEPGVGDLDFLALTMAAFGTKR